jgi:hypothetical protein
VACLMSGRFGSVLPGSTTLGEKVDVARHLVVMQCSGVADRRVYPGRMPTLPLAGLEFGSKAGVWPKERDERLARQTDGTEKTGETPIPLFSAKTFGARPRAMEYEYEYEY